MKVHIHLAYGFGKEAWQRRHASGALIGMNDADPYGYYRAEHMGAQLTSSLDHAEGRLGYLVRMGFRALLGFDFLHAWRNRGMMSRSEIVWTHTESQFLAVCLTFILSGHARNERPKIIGQSVWMMDGWQALSWPRRQLWRALIRHVDIMTFLSPDNLAVAEREFPGIRKELVLFGINADGGMLPVARAPHDGLKLVAIGNDIHRDWATLIAAVAPRPDWRLTIVSKTCNPRLADGIGNVTIRVVDNTSDLLNLYQQADLAIVPLRPNLHASGITVMLEAAIAGLPMIVSDVGGLKAYFDDRQVRYVPEGDAGQLREAIADLAIDRDERMTMAIRAQARIGPQGLSSESYARRHVELSRTLLVKTGVADTVGMSSLAGEPVATDADNNLSEHTRRHAGSIVAR